MAVADGRLEAITEHKEDGGENRPMAKSKGGKKNNSPINFPQLFPYIFLTIF